MQVPVEAPQGPTCIYRPRTGKDLIAVAVQETDFGALRRQIKRIHRVDVGDRTAYCGSYGQPMLYVPLAERARPEHQRTVRRRPRVRPQGAPPPLDPPTPDKKVSRVPGLHTDRPPAWPPPTAVARAVGDPRPPDRGAARAHEPVHGHLVGDGRHGAAALPRLRRQLLAARLRGHRRPLQRRDGDRPARQRLHRRPLAAAQGGRGVGLRALGDLQAAARRRRHLGVGDRRGRAGRPGGQGDQDRAA